MASKNNLSRSDLQIIRPWPPSGVRQLNKDTDELAKMYGMGAGARIHSVHHRQPGPPSMMSSSASVSTNAGSTAALLHPSRNKKTAKKKNNLQSYHKHNFYPNVRPKELNALLTHSVAIPTAKKKREKHKKISTASQVRFLDEGDSDNEEFQSRVDVKYVRQEGKSNFIPQILAALTVSLGSCVVGFASAYTSPALPSMKAGNSPPITQSEGSWIGSLMPLSALIGGMAGGPLIEYIGRRTTILITAPPFIISFLLIAMASNVAMIMAGRSLAGFCVGICSLALPVYLGETVQPEVRGTLGLLPSTLGNVGILLGFISGKYLDWRYLAYLGAVIPVPFLICMFLIPESPQWHISRHQQKKAKKSLQWLRGPEADISQEFEELERTNHVGKNQEPPGFTTLFNRMYIRPLSISIGLMFFQQFSGINAVIFYTVDIFLAAGSTIDRNIATIIVGLVNFFSTFIATAFIDKLGRKILLYASSVIMGCMLLTLGTFFYYKDALKVDTSTYGWIPLMSFVVYVVGFSIGFGPIPWLMMGEILPAKIRGSAASLATAFNWSCTFLVTKTYADMTEWIGNYGTFWLFGASTVLSLLFVILFVPETQGKSLEDIERNLTGDRKGPIRNVRRMSSIAHLKPLPMAV